MTKREMIEAMLAGKKLITSYGSIAYFDESKSGHCFMFQSNDHDRPPEPLMAWESNDWKIQEDPKKRPMTRDEVLGFLANNPYIVVRMDNDSWSLSGQFYFHPENIEVCEWATILRDGKIGEPHKFEVAE